MKQENQTWIEYIKTEHGSEVLTRVELIVRNFVVNHPDILEDFNDANDGALKDILFDPKGVRRAPLETWGKFSEFLDNIANIRDDKFKLYQFLLLDDFLGLIYTNFYTNLTTKDVLVKCKKFLEDKLVRETYLMDRKAARERANINEGN